MGRTGRNKGEREQRQVVTHRQARGPDSADRTGAGGDTPCVGSASGCVAGRQPSVGHAAPGGRIDPMRHRIDPLP